MHGWGQWYALAAAAVVAVCHLGGRRGRTWPVVVLLCGVEVAAAIAVAHGQDTVSWLVDQAVVVLAVFAALTGSYLRLRQEFVEQGWARARAARLRERARIAADLHDTLGHDLTLLSLQAAGLQVTAPDEPTREQAAALRAGSAAAIDTVRRIVDLLDVEAEADVVAVFDRARAAGMTVEVTGVPPADRFLARLVSEALSNAARHAPGTAVTVAFNGRRVEIVNPVSPRELPERAGTGLSALAGRVRHAGGSLAADRVDGRFRLVAEIPPGIDEDHGHGDYDTGRLRIRRMLAGTVLIPGAVLVVVATGFYAWAVRDASMEEEAFGALRVGMPRAAAVTLLPAREAPVRFERGYGPGCHYYTDGNYPLAYGNYVVCFEGDRVVRLHDGTGRTA